MPTRLSFLTLLLVILALSTGCTQSHEPITADELDKFIAHDTVLHQTIQDAGSSYTGMNIKERDQIILKARNNTIEKLGWDVQRYDYIRRSTQNIFWIDYMKWEVANLQKKSRSADTKQDREATLRELGETQQKLTAMEKKMEKAFTVAERVLMHERQAKLVKIFEKKKLAFKYI